MNRVQIFSLSAAAAVALLAVGYIAGHRGAGRSAAPIGAPSASPRAVRRILYWYDPMVPEQHFDQPGLSPMHMQMVPKYADSTSGDRGVIRIDPASEQNLGMRTTTVLVGTLKREVRVSGTIAWDLRRAHSVSARTDGLIDRLYVRAPLASVNAGQPLATMRAPQWEAAAQEYLALRGARSADARALTAAARTHLEALGMDAAQIRGLHAGVGHIVLRAPITGVVSVLNVREGDQVRAGMPLMTVNGLDTVWLDAAIPQAQSAGIVAGTPVQAHVSATPETILHGQVEELLPDVDAATRAQRARIVLANPDRRLAPGMFAEVLIRGAVGVAHPLVPDGALISTGIQTRVILAEGGGRFKPIEVRVGSSSGGMTEVLAGLQGGERIVVSGQFLIDSEASFSGAMERLSGPRAQP